MSFYSVDGYSCELNFLTHIPTLYNNENKDTIWNQLQGELSIEKSADGKIIRKKTAEQKDPKRIVVFKGNKDGNIKNYYKENIYQHNDYLNPYLRLLKDFEVKGFESVRLVAADFTYLTNLGVYPINRLWILRRFKEGDVVPDNLLDWKDGTKYPMATVAGWITPDKEDFFNIDFHEEWKITTDRVDEVLMKMMEKEFKFKTASIMSLPGWSQGLLMGFLKEMGITNDFGFDKIPFGNPDVLQEAATRAISPDTGYGLKSTMTMTLKTGYEQKYIGDIDPGSAMQDIIRNLTRMGTSDTVFFGNKDSDVLNELRNATTKNTLDAWWTFIMSVMTAFINAISNLFKQLKSAFEKKTDEEKTEEKKTDEEIYEERMGRNKTKTDKTKTDKTTDKKLDIVTSIGNKFKNIPKEDRKKDDDGNLIGVAIQTILASTVAKWKWPLKGGLGVITGENTTPWHLTIGNPYSPFVSLGNIKVDDVNIKFKNELGYNDIPTRLETEIKISLGRNLGGQEIFAMFNNGYKRVYDKKANSGKGANISINKVI